MNRLTQPPTAAMTRSARIARVAHKKDARFGSKSASVGRVVLGAFTLAFAARLASLVDDADAVDSRSPG
jgi:hypothetical protein